MHPAHKRRLTIAKEWQLAVLKKLQSVSSNPTEGQCAAAAAETGLDEKWVKSWFTRQRSKLSVRNRKSQSVTTDPHLPRAYPATTPPPELQPSHQDPSFRRSTSTPTDPALYLSTKFRQPPPVSLQPRSPRLLQATVSAQAAHRPLQSASARTHPNNPHQDPTLVPHPTTTSTYSRDPLYNRHPDFSQFFRPLVHERFRITELLAPLNNHNHLLVNPNINQYAIVHFQGFSNMLDPLHLGGHPAYASFSASLRPCPIAFSMRLADLLGHP